MLLTAYKSALKSRYSLKWESLFLQENYHVWKDAIHSLMRLSLPLISLVWPWLFVFWWSWGNRVRKMLWSNIWVRTPDPWPPPNGMVPQALGNTGHGTIHTYIHTHIHTRIHTYIPIYLPTYLHTYIPTYLRTYVPTYTRTYIHAYMHACMDTYIPTYLHTYIHIYIDTNIPTYQHTTTTGHGGGDQKNHTTTTGHRGGTRRTIPPSQATGGTMGGLGRPGSYIYIYVCIYVYVSPVLPQWYGPPPPPKPRIYSHLGGTASQLYGIWEAQPPICLLFSAFESRNLVTGPCLAVYFYPKPV